MRSSTLSNVDLKKFCQKLNLPFSMCTLEELNTSSTIDKYCFVFTGSESDNYNNSYHNHWLFLYGNKLFDTYSYQKYYTLPSWVEPVKLYPSVIQQFGSNVCGEYCCAFYWFIKNIKAGDASNLGIQFCNFFHLSTSRDQNDEKINKWFDQITKEKNDTH